MKIRKKLDFSKYSRLKLKWRFSSKKKISFQKGTKMESNEERKYKYYPKKRFYLRMGEILLDLYYTSTNYDF